MNKFVSWQLENKNHIMRIYNIVLNDLEEYDLQILDKKKLYKDIILYLYQSTIHVKYIN